MNTFLLIPEKRGMWSVALLITSLVITGCGGGSAGGAMPPEPGPPPPPPAVVLDQDNVASAAITPGGGSISTTASDGTVYTLALEPGSLSSSTEITLTPVLEMNELAVAGALLGAVQLEPDGLILQVPATLSMELAAPATAGAVLLGFDTQNAGEAMELKSTQVTGNTATIELEHFSIGGAMEITDEEILQYAFDLYYGTGQFLDNLTNVTSCTGAALNDAGRTTAELMNLADILLENHPTNIEFDPRSCIFSTDGVEEFQCMDIFDLAEASRISLQNVVESTFADADIQCGEGDATREVAALECIAYAQRNDLLVTDSNLDLKLMDLKLCGISTIEIVPDETFLAIGESGLLEAVSRDQSGNALQGRDTSWESLDESIATVAGDGNIATVTGQQDGNTFVQARDQMSVDAGVIHTGFSLDDASISVGLSVEITPAWKRLFPADSVQLTGVLKGPDEKVITVNSFNWTNSNSDVASLDRTTGLDVLVTAVSGGAATITATDEPTGTSGTATISVVNNEGTSISSGGLFSCAVQEGSVWCWGWNQLGQLGIGTNVGPEFCHGEGVFFSCSTDAVQALGISTATAVAAGQAHACALLIDGTVKCWGYNNAGQLGDGTDAGPENCGSVSYDCSTLPREVVGISTATSVTAGWAHACALLNDGTVKCWGSNAAGSLGVDPDSVGITSTPITVDGITSVAGIAAGSRFTCALLTEGTIKCWGYNSGGTLGNGTRDLSFVPVSVSGIDSAIAISAGYVNACAIVEGGGAMCWGNNVFGQLGIGTRFGPQTCSTNLSIDDCSTLPLEVEGINSVSSISIGSGFICAVIADGTVNCWGKNLLGQLGIGTDIGPDDCRWESGAPGVSCSTSPVPVFGITNAKSVAGGSQQTCAVMQDGTGWCWGRSDFGSLGHGDFVGPEDCSGTIDSPDPDPDYPEPCSTVPVQVQ